MPKLILITLLITLAACAPAFPPHIESESVTVSVQELNYSCTEAEMPQLELTMFNVSQGQSILLRIPKRTNIILMTGQEPLDSAGMLNTQYTNIIYDAGPKIKGKPLPDTIDQLIISNPDKDHLAGAAWILDVKQVNKYIEPGILPCNTNTCAMVKEKVKNEPGIQTITAYTGDKIYEEDTPTFIRKDCHTKTGAWAEQKYVQHTTATIEYLNPDPLEPFNNDNDNSIVLLVTYFNTTILLMGDCEKACENKLIEKHYPRDVDVLVAGHHGSSTSSSEAFISMVNPKIALISVGANNQYGHPSQEVLDRLTSHGASIYRTDTQGTIKLTSDGTMIGILTVTKKAV